MKFVNFLPPYSELPSLRVLVLEGTFQGQHKLGSPILKLWVTDHSEQNHTSQIIRTPRTILGWHLIHKGVREGV